MNYITSPLKYPGGKGSLFPQLYSFLPPKFLKVGNLANRVAPNLFSQDIRLWTPDDSSFNYCEPFLGGGSFFLNMYNSFKLKNVVINDKNIDIYIFFRVIKEEPDLFFKYLDILINNYKKTKTLQDKQQFYLKMRNLYNILKFNLKGNIPNISWAKCASLLLFLNKTCYNGLFRFNQQGEFNAHYGKLEDNIFFYNKEYILTIHKWLQKIKILNCDFQDAIKECDNTYFIYFDPPYFPYNPKTANFTYTRNFNEKDHIRLFHLFKDLDNNGYLLMMSNSDTDFIKKLYSNYNINYVYANRLINVNKNSRNKIKELVITNY